MLLQGAFNMNALASSTIYNGLWEMTQSIVFENKVTGPIIITHNKTDGALRLAYQSIKLLGRTVTTQS